MLWMGRHCPATRPRAIVSIAQNLCPILERGQLVINRIDSAEIGFVTRALRAPRPTAAERGGCARLANHPKTEGRTVPVLGWRSLAACASSGSIARLLTQEIACDTVATIEDTLAVIRQGVARACPGPSRSRLPLKGKQPRAAGSPAGSFLLVRCCKTARETRPLP